MHKKYFGLVAIILIGMIACGASEGENARSVVINFVKDLRSNRDFSLERYLDVNELVRENAANVYLYDSAKSISENIESFEGLFKPEGKLRLLWTQKQIVIGEAEVLGDTALVEVSFIDRQTHKQYYNKMGLKRTDSGWLIFAFKLL